VCGSHIYILFIQLQFGFRVVKNSEIKLLKVLVYAMGFSLIFAVLFLTYIAYHKSFSEPISAEDTKTLLCSPITLEVEGKVRQVSSSKGCVHVLWHDHENVLKLSIYNVCNGNLINTVTIKSKEEEQGTGENKIGEGIY
jgi:hypothetical protein